MKRPEEKKLYPIVERWLKRHYKCFATGVDAGLRIGRIDVVGFRDVGGDLSGEVESIAIEVKRGTAPFATASGQTLGYRVYANRVYLADVRQNSFTLDEVSIASHLGIGLIQIKGGRCIETLSSPHYRPITKFNLLLMEHLHWGYCQICDSVFRISDHRNNLFAKLSRENLWKARELERGLMFWNREVAERKNKLGIRKTEDDSTFERRFICPDCIHYVISQFVLWKDTE